jgi:hypothetical protein
MALNAGTPTDRAIELGGYLAGQSTHRVLNPPAGMNAWSERLWVQGFDRGYTHYNGHAPVRKAAPKVVAAPKVWNTLDGKASPSDLLKVELERMSPYLSRSVSTTDNTDPHWVRWVRAQAIAKVSAQRNDPNRGRPAHLGSHWAIESIIADYNGGGMAGEFLISRSIEPALNRWLAASTPSLRGVFDFGSTAETALYEPGRPQPVPFIWYNPEHPANPLSDAAIELAANAKAHAEMIADERFADESPFEEREDPDVIKERA